jgi:hypothetical protein
MGLSNIDNRITNDGQARLSDSEYSFLNDLVVAGDRGGFHYLYSELANNEDARTTAKISTFSDYVGGSAFAANWFLQAAYQGTYPGIYNISQQIAEDLLQRIDSGHNAPARPDSVHAAPH